MGPPVVGWYSCFQRGIRTTALVADKSESTTVRIDRSVTKGDSFRLGYGCLIHWNVDEDRLRRGMGFSKFPRSTNGNSRSQVRQVAAIQDPNCGLCCHMTFGETDLLR